MQNVGTALSDQSQACIYKKTIRQAGDFKLIGTKDIPALGALGISQRLPFEEEFEFKNDDIKFGWDIIKVKADCKQTTEQYNEIRELDETNNEITSDAVLPNLKPSVLATFNGDKFWVVDRTKAVTKEFTVCVAVTMPDGSNYREKTKIKSISADDWKELKFKHHVLSGSTVEINADCEHKILEADETDNIVAQTIIY